MMIGKEGVMGATYDGEDYDTGDKLGFLKATVSLALKHEDLGGDFRDYLKKL